MSYPVTIALLLNLIAMTGLALAMPKHHQQLIQVPPTLWRKRTLRFIAIVLMSLSVVLVAQAWGLAVGIVLWIGLLSLAAVLSVCLLNHQLLRSATILSACLLITLGFIF